MWQHFLIRSHPGRSSGLHIFIDHYFLPPPKPRKLLFIVLGLTPNNVDAMFYFRFHKGDSILMKQCYAFDAAD